MLMKKSISLSQYVKKRNGVALGAPESMSNMLKRSLGAGSFHGFWRNWNPIWGYYLSRNVMKPLCQFTPLWLATILTFAVSGALHDVAVSLLKGQVFLFFTPWFVCMSSVVLLSHKWPLNYAHYSLNTRALINGSIIAVCYVISMAIFK